MAKKKYILETKAFILLSAVDFMPISQYKADFRLIPKRNGLGKIRFPTTKQNPCVVKHTSSSATFNMEKCTHAASSRPSGSGCIIPFLASYPICKISRTASRT